MLLLQSYICRSCKLPRIKKLIAKIYTFLSKCVTSGCDGIGHVTGKFPTHFTLSGCPNAKQNQNKVMKSLSVDTNQGLAPQKKERKRRFVILFAVYYSTNLCFGC